MTPPTSEQIQSYLELYHLTEDALASRANVTVERIQELVRWRCIPPHTHAIRTQTSMSGCFGDLALAPSEVRYFHKSVLQWIVRAEKLSDALPLCDLAEKIRRDFYDDFVAELADRQTPWPGMNAEEGAAYAWAFVMDGTWGACLKSIDVPSMLAKEYARQAFRKVAAISDTEVLEPNLLEDLLAAVQNYDRVAQEFAPHERPESSRVNEFEPARARLEAAQLARAA